MSCTTAHKRQFLLSRLFDLSDSLGHINGGYFKLYQNEGLLGLACLYSIGYVYTTFMNIVEHFNFTVSFPPLVLYT